MPSNQSRRSHHDRSHRDPFRGLPSPDRQSSDESGSFGSVITAALFALPFSLLCGLVLLSIMAALAFAQADPNALATPLSLAVLGLSATVGGLICSRRCGRAALSCGLFFGLLFVALTWVLSLLFGDRAGNALSLGLSMPVSLLLRAAVVAFSCLGARMGARRTRAPAHHRLG